MVIKILYPIKFINKAIALIICHCIDCKIPAFKVIDKLCRKFNAFRMPSILIFAINSVCSHFVSGMVHHNRYSTMLYACINSLFKKWLYLLWSCGRSNIPVIRVASKYTVPYTAAYCICFISVIFNGLYNSSYIIRKVNPDIFHSVTPYFQ